MRIAIIYWSSTGNTEMMAASIAEGARSNGAQVDLLPASQSDYLVLEKYYKFAFGGPPVGDDELDDTEFLPFYEQIEEGLANRKVALFGSYGWGDGLWMREWQERIKAKGALLFEEGLIIHEDSLPADVECRAFGERFALF